MDEKRNKLLVAQQSQPVEAAPMSKPSSFLCLETAKVHSALYCTYTSALCLLLKRTLVNHG